MTVSMQGPLALLSSKGKSPPRGSGDDNPSLVADDANSRVRSFADILAAAQPDGEDSAAKASPLPVDSEEKADKRPADVGLDAALPSWLVPTPALDIVRVVAQVASTDVSAPTSTRDPLAGIDFSPRTAVGGVTQDPALPEAAIADMSVPLPPGPETDFALVAAQVATTSQPAAALGLEDMAAPLAQAVAALVPEEVRPSTPAGETSVAADAGRVPLDAPPPAAHEDAGSTPAPTFDRVALTTGTRATGPSAVSATTDPRPTAQTVAQTLAQPVAQLVARSAGQPGGRPGERSLPAEGAPRATAGSPPSDSAPLAALATPVQTAARSGTQNPAQSPERNAGAEEAPGVAFIASRVPPHVASADNPAAAAPGDGTPTPAPAESTAAVATTSVGDGPAPAAVAPEAHVVERTPTSVTIAIERPVASAGWAQEVTGAIAQAITVRHSTAQLHLHPESMGPVDVRITMSGSEASVQLVAPHAATREALEQAMPMLRELLGNQGLALGQTAVEARAQQQDAAPPPPQAPVARDAAAPAGVPVVEDAPASVARVLRLLDVFA